MRMISRGLKLEQHGSTIRSQWVVPVGKVKTGKAVPIWSPFSVQGFLVGNKGRCCALHTIKLKDFLESEVF